MTSAVYFADTRAKHGNNLYDKIDALYEKAGCTEIIKENDLVA